MAFDEDIEELKRELSKLSPIERVKKLKELEEKRKEENDEIEDMIKDSEESIKVDNIAEEIAPEQNQVNINDLFSEEEPSLESAVNEETKSDEITGIGYLSSEQIQEDYTELRDLTNASLSGTLEQSQMQSIDKIGERLEKIKYHSASEEVANMLVASRAALYKIKKYAGLEK